MGVKKPDRKFKLATTSYIYPGPIYPNVERLAPVFDEIEILVFESIPASVLPSRGEIDSLLQLKSKFGVGFNIHLPVDVSLSAATDDARKKACRTIGDVMALFEPLAPSSHTLHLEFTGDPESKASIEAWKTRCKKGIECLLENRIGPGGLSVENLDYPIEWLDDILDAFDLGLCLDAGHLAARGLAALEAYRRRRERVSLIHLHGVETRNGEIRDHRPLDTLEDRYFDPVCRLLDDFTGVLVLEVFGADPLIRSLARLSGRFSGIPAL